MKSVLNILLLSLILLSACKAKKVAIENTQKEKLIIVENKEVLNGFNIKNIEDINKEDLLFQVKDMEIKDKNLYIDVQYSGGCVKPHIFDLVTDGVIDSNGRMDFYLLHKTHNDMCKALLLEELKFDLEQLYGLKSTVLKSIRINKMPKIDLD